MSNNGTRTQTLVPKDLLPEYVFPDEPPEALFYGLTGIERKFVRCYVESGDSFKAFRDAGLEHGQKHPKNLAYIYLRRPRIRNAVHRLQAYYAHHMGIHAEQILGLLHAQATLDPVSIYQHNGDTWELKPMAQWPLEARQAVQRIRVIERVTKEGDTRHEIDIEFADRQRALALLGKHLRLFERGDKQIAPFTLVIQHAPEEPPAPKPVGRQVIDGIGLQIQLPAADKP